MALDVAAVKASANEVVLAAADPAAAAAAFVKVWALGGMAGEDLLDDLECHAVYAGLARGVELTAPELFVVAGHPERADRVREAVETGRAAWIEAAARAGRLFDLRLAREVA